MPGCEKEGRDLFNYDVRERIRLNLRDYYFCVKARLSRGGGKRLVFCNSFPKSGTHLLAEILRRFDGVRYWNDIVAMQSLSGVMNHPVSIECKVASAPNNGLVRCHLSAHDQIKQMVREHAAAHFLIYRDPRDVAVSHANWVLKEPRFYLHSYYKDHLRSFDACLMASITGMTIGSEFGSNLSHPDIAANYSRWLGWFDDKDCMCIRFEDLVGERGGGDEEKRLSIVRQLHSVMNVPAPESLTESYGSSAMDPSESHTFRKGKKGLIGGWKEVFQPEHTDAFKRISGDLLVRLGYEQNDGW